MVPTLNLNAQETVPTNYTTFPIDPTEFNVLDADTFNSSTSTTVYDSLGNDFPATMYFVASNPMANEWQVRTFVDGNPLTINAAADDFFTMTFDGLGSFQDVTTSAGTTTNSNIGFDGLALGNGASNLTMNFDYSATTQYGGGFAVNGLNQNGFASGRLSGIEIDQTGVVFALSLIHI